MNSDLKELSYREFLEIVSAELFLYSGGAMIAFSTFWPLLDSSVCIYYMLYGKTQKSVATLPLDEVLCCANKNCNSHISFKESGCSVWPSLRFSAPSDPSKALVEESRVPSGLPPPWLWKKKSRLIWLCNRSCLKCSTSPEDKRSKLISWII